MRPVSRSEVSLLPSSCRVGLGVDTREGTGRVSGVDGENEEG